MEQKFIPTGSELGLISPDIAEMLRKINIIAHAQGYQHAVLAMLLHELTLETSPTKHTVSQLLHSDELQALEYALKEVLGTRETVLSRVIKDRNLANVSEKILEGVYIGGRKKRNRNQGVTTASDMPTLPYKVLHKLLEIRELAGTIPQVIHAGTLARLSYHRLSQLEGFGYMSEKLLFDLLADIIRSLASV